MYYHNRITYTKIAINNKYLLNRLLPKPITNVSDIGYTNDWGTLLVKIALAMLRVSTRLSLPKRSASIDLTFRQRNTDGKPSGCYKV